MDWYSTVGDFPGGSAVKNLPVMQETRVRSQGWEDLLEKEMATQPQYSCLGNPMDRGAWRATVHGVEKELDTTARLTATIVSLSGQGSSLGGQTEQI